MRQTGGCQCGAVRFSTSDTPVKSMACHCKACKLRTGAAYGIGVYFEDKDVQFNQGKRQHFTFYSDTSGRWLQNEFCPVCACTVSWTLEMRPGLRGIAGGCFDNADWYELDSHIWTQSARSDMCYPDDMIRHESTAK